MSPEKAEPEKPAPEGGRKCRSTSLPSGLHVIRKWRLRIVKLLVLLNHGRPSGISGFPAPAAEDWPATNHL